MLKRLLSAVFLLALFLEILLPISRVSAALPTIVDQPATPSQPSIVITAFGGGLPDFFELYNQSSQPVALDGWQINFIVQGNDPTSGQIVEAPYTVTLPHGWLLPKQYHMLQRGVSTSGVSTYQLDIGLQNPVLTTVELVNAEGVVQYIVSPAPALSATQWAQHKQRTNASLKMSDIFATDYVLKTVAPTGFSDALYTPPNTIPIKIVEILPNSRDCSPLDTSLDCTDYIKLYNPTATTIDLSGYRLRTDSGGLKSSATNTFTLSQTVAPGGYATIHVRDSGEPMSITNTGGYIWLEDMYGVKVYQETMVAYPDASATKNKGLSWAFNGGDYTWKWMPPAPNAPNYWPPDVTAKGGGTSAGSGYVDCGPGRERNPATNRCRNTITTSSSSLTPCKAGQERNLETNRCRSVLSAHTSLQPCDQGQYRNPTTNRCKKIESASGLAPCKSGYERNPETNRCKKITLAGKDIPNVKDVESKAKANMTNWWFAGVAVCGALAYGAYEWRDDIAQRFKRLQSK